VRGRFSRPRKNRGRPYRAALRKRRILPVISRKDAPNIKGMGKLRYVVEQTFALLHRFKRLPVRWERRPELHDAFISLACSLMSSGKPLWRRTGMPETGGRPRGEA